MGFEINKVQIVTVNGLNMVLSTNPSQCISTLVFTLYTPFSNFISPFSNFISPLSLTLYPLSLTLYPPFSNFISPFL